MGHGNSYYSRKFHFILASFSFTSSDVLPDISALWRFLSSLFRLSCTAVVHMGHRNSHLSCKCHFIWRLIPLEFVTCGLTLIFNHSATFFKFLFCVVLVDAGFIAISIDHGLLLHFVVSFLYNLSCVIWYCNSMMVPFYFPVFLSVGVHMRRCNSILSCDCHHVLPSYFFRIYHVLTDIDFISLFSFYAFLGA